MRTCLKIKNKSRPYLILVSGNQGGQAIIEYVLALTLAAILIVSLAAFIFKPFGTFVKDSLGTYTKCLLETGEVPRLGGPTNIKEETDCFAQFQAGQKPANGSGGSGSNRDPSNPQKTAQTNVNGDRAGEGEGGGGSGSPSRSGSGRGFSGVRGQTGDNSAGSGKVTQIPARDLPASAGTFKTSGESVWEAKGKNTRKVVLDSSSLTAAQKEEIAKRDLSKKIRSVESNEKLKQAKKVAVKPPPERKIAEVESDDGFALGKIIRVIFIILIILVLLVVLGGQGFKLFKGWEK